MPHADTDQLSLTDFVPQAPGELPWRKRIYCNRDLRFDLITAIGFDMDYTLALYRQEALDRLSIDATVEKLVARGYPESLRSMELHLRFPIRGLLIDKELGHVVKTDRYRYPKKAYHGTRLLSSEERRQAYQNHRLRPGTPRYHSIDTLFGLSEVTVYAAVIDALEAAGAGSLDFGAIFSDIRASIDEAHRDGSIKDVIRKNPGAFLERDPALGATLHRLRSAGKRLFLLTNSEPDYTDIVMRYLLSDDADYGDWCSYFDIILTDARKPHFFTGHDRFIDSTRPERAVEQLVRGRMYQGGSLKELERLASLTGDRVLYVGDHIYGDVLRAKKVSAWRTLMVVQELADELSATRGHRAQLARMDELERQRYDLLDVVRERQFEVKRLRQMGATIGVTGMASSGRAVLERARAQIEVVERELAELEERVDRAHHPYWGSLFKAESELSSFGEQVERYACIYTDRVTNLLHYGPHHFFRGPRHRMAHDQP